LGSLVKIFVEKSRKVYQLTQKINIRRKNL